MRQRKARNLETRMAAYEDWLIRDPASMKRHWRELARSAGTSGNIWLEIGCGKGKFITEIASRYPDRFYIAVEGHQTVIFRALEKAEELGLTNVCFIPQYIVDVRDWFDLGEVDGIYLNFSDPLPKNYSAKKRLTHRLKLEQYFDILSENGVVNFKTDNIGLFEFTLQEVRAMDLEMTELTWDLHRCEYDEDNIRTEYEEKFSGLGENIKQVKIRRKTGGSSMGFAAMNGRTIPKEDKFFGLSGRAKAAIAENGKDAVINATVGALLDDAGDLIVLSSVDEVVKSLPPAAYAEYAPIAGTPGYREAIQKAAFGSYQPKGFTGAVASPGGTGALRNAVANYTCPGDTILTHDWFWTTYKNIAMEIGRNLTTFEMFDADGRFNLTDFEYKVKKLLRVQDRVLVILNTPASNPTGYSLSDEDWDGVIRILNETPERKKLTLVIDTAYIDYAGEADAVRSFLPKLEALHENILTLFAYSASKTFTFYGCRTAALICLTPSEEIRDEFLQVCTFSSRASWSNSPRGPQEVITKIYADPELLARVDEERKTFRDMLLVRGRAFEEEAAKIGLKMVPYRGGFFASVPCKDPDTVSRKLEELLVFAVPFANGVRVSLASISEEKCRKVPALMLKAIKYVNHGFWEE